MGSLSTSTPSLSKITRSNRAIGRSYPAADVQGSSVNPADRVKFVVETAKAVLDDRSPQGAASLQAEQLVPLLGDRLGDPVECESVATNRMLAEQINDRGRTGLRSDPELEATRPWPAVGEMAQALR